MKKILVYMLIITCLFSFGFTQVYAAKSSGSSSSELVTKEGTKDCRGLIGEDGVELIKDILNYIRIIVPILLIVLIMIDFAGAIISDYTDEAIQKKKDPLTLAMRKSVKRIIAAVLLFFVPTLVKVVLDLPGVHDWLTVSHDPLCRD